ncbi:MAG: hypothetical protein HN919_07615 [Verrucomicrobia bacterium]|mgnify:CR=1 FL=1|jgi:hypothetical protein|nr:hypothetical protein [Verrucomicrobiota bacterium]MBT7066155.1 hypothetical protein [Verrucomicrobiota bacterium]MBT7699417.1 hypothetical protein [Verrucomicrobiota bacterium]
MHISLKRFASVATVLAVIPVSMALSEIAVMVEEVAVRPAATLTVAPPSDAVPEQGGKPVTTEGVDLLTLVNGDSLHGALVSIDPADYGLRWQHASATAPIDFGLKAIAQVKLAPRETPRRRPNDARVRLTNDDLLDGQVVQLSDTELTLDTWYSGRVVVQRPMLKSLAPNASVSPDIYRGPTDFDSWTKHRSARGAWRLKNGALYSSTSYAIGRTIEKMPDMANIQFDAAWVHGYPAFYFAFFTDNLTSYSGNSYALRISNTSVYFYRYSSNRGSQNMGNVDVQELSKSKQATFNILADRKNRAFTLLINGRMVKQWTDSGASPGPGKGIVFDPDNENPMKFRNISITQWDGTVPKQGAAPQAESEEDVIQFINDDKVSGHLTSIANGAATFKTSYASLDVPLERAVRIDMSSETAERARRNGGDIRAHFAGSNAGLVTVGLERIQESTVNGQSENFGPIQMPLAAFALLEFNIYRDKSDEESDDTLF